MKPIQHAQIDNLLFLVLRTIFHYERIIARDYGLDFQQIYALQLLHRHPNTRFTEIASEMELPKFTTSRLLNRLVKDGFVSKKQDQADHRNYYLLIEEKGELVIQAIETASCTKISTNIQSYSTAEVAELFEVAERLNMVLGVSDKVKNS